MTQRFLYREFGTQAQIDAQYSADVPDYPAWVQAWQAASCEARETLPCELRVPYGPTLAETLDVFPAAQPNAPVLVFLHGGYWRSFAAEDFSFVATGPRACGFTTVLVDYALCPWVSLGEIVRQVRASLAWVHRHIASHGGDPKRIAVSGHSAGGQLAAMSLFTSWSRDYGLPDDLVKAALPISGLFDLEPLRHSYLQPVLQLDEGAVRRNSPLQHVQATDAAVLACWGENESSEFARQSQAFAGALQAVGARVETYAVPGAHHCSVLEGFRDPASRICRWLTASV